MGMTPTQIKIELLKKNVSQRDIAKALGVADATVNKIIYRQGESKRVKEAISKIIGKPVNKIWPSRYVKDNTAKRILQSISDQ